MLVENFCETEHTSVYTLKLMMIMVTTNTMITTTTVMMMTMTMPMLMPTYKNAYKDADLKDI